MIRDDAVGPDLPPKMIRRMTNQIRNDRNYSDSRLLGTIKEAERDRASDAVYRKPLRDEFEIARLIYNLK